MLFAKLAKEVALIFKWIGTNFIFRTTSYTAKLQNGNRYNATVVCKHFMNI